MAATAQSSFRTPTEEGGEEAAAMVRSIKQSMNRASWNLREYEFIMDIINDLDATKSDESFRAQFHRMFHERLRTYNADDGGSGVIMHLLYVLFGSNPAAAVRTSTAEDDAEDAKYKVMYKQLVDGLTDIVNRGSATTGSSAASANAPEMMGPWESLVRTNLAKLKERVAPKYD